MAIEIISQRNIGDGQFMLQLSGLSTDTKPTDSFVANGSQFVETDSDAVYEFNTTWQLTKNGQMKDLPVVDGGDNGKFLKVDNGVWTVGDCDGGSSDSTSELPAVTGDDNGKVLTVVEGAWGAAEAAQPSGGDEPFVVTLTTQDGQSFTGDKTYAEIVEAKMDGQRVVFVYETTGSQNSFEALTIQTSPTASAIQFIFARSIANATFTPEQANDLFEWNL